MCRNIQQHYRNLVKKYGDSYLSAQYSSEETQNLRFHHLLRAGNISDKKVLDFGCGTAALAGYIERQGINCQYVGYDFVEEFYPIAQNKYPGARFVSKSEFVRETYEYIFVSGVFNNRIDNNELFYKNTLKMLFDSAEICVSFNMLSMYVDYFDSDLFYVYPEDVFKFCKTNITPYVSIVNDYSLKRHAVPFEFSCYLYR